MKTSVTNGLSGPGVFYGVCDTECVGWLCEGLIVEYDVKDEMCVIVGEVCEREEIQVCLMSVI